MVRQRQPRVKDKKYLAFIGELGRDYGCVICRRPAEVAHVRMAEVCKECDGKGTVDAGHPILNPGEIWLICLECDQTGHRFSKRPTGAGEKPDDKWTLPLCPDCHRLGKESQHSMNERDWWADKGIDALALCKRLQDAYPSVRDGVQVLANGVGR